MVIQASFYIKGFYNSPWADTHIHIHAHILTSWTKARAKTINITHNSTFLRIDKSAVPSSTSRSTFNNSMQNTQTTWHFLIKAPYLGILSVIYDTENKGLSHFSTDENKGLKSIAEIRCSVIQPLIIDSMASIRLVT